MEKKEKQELEKKMLKKAEAILKRRMKKLKVIDDIPEDDELDEEVKTITKPKPKEEPKEEPKPEPPKKEPFIVIKSNNKNKGLFYR